jgi:hypothetical protein
MILLETGLRQAWQAGKSTELFKGKSATNGTKNYEPL